MYTSDDRSARRVESRVRRFIKEHRLLTPGGRLLLAVSGGPDSLALLMILARLSPRLDTPMTAAYVDHGVRPPTETAADRELIAAVTRDLDVRFITGSIERDEGTHGRSPEEVWRRARYRALATLARGTGASVVATGHTRTDQAETVLLRLVRGTGLHGLGAMAPFAPWPVATAGVERSPRLIRPLLTLGREETAAYCAARGVVPRSDPENANPRYLRTRIRRDVLPALRALNPKVEAALAGLAEEAAGWRSMLMERLDPVVMEEYAGGVALDRRALGALPAQERVAMLRVALERIEDDRPAPSGAHLRALERIVAIDRAGEVHLPGGMRAWTDGSRLVLGRDRTPPAPLPTVQVPVPGDLELPGWRVRAALVQVEEPPAAGDPWTVTLDANVADGLEVGPRRPGDRIDIGVGHSRLQDLLVDRKVPRADRDLLPVFRTARGVAWVAGVRVAAWARPSSSSPFLRLRVEPSRERTG